MAILPKRTKHRKQHRRYHDGHSKGATKLNFGEYGLQATEGAWLTTNQIEAARVAITRCMKRGGKLWINLIADLPLSKKPLETRMGKGKGDPVMNVAVVKEGRIMFEIADMDEATAREAMRLAASKLPIKCKFIKKGSEANEK